MYDDKNRVYDVLDHLDQTVMVDAVIEGGASGAGGAPEEGAVEAGGHGARLCRTNKQQLSCQEKAHAGRWQHVYR